MSLLNTIAGMVVKDIADHDGKQPKRICIAPLVRDQIKEDMEALGAKKTSEWSAATLLGIEVVIDASLVPMVIERE